MGDKRLHGGDEDLQFSNFAIPSRQNLQFTCARNLDLLEALALGFTFLPNSVLARLLLPL
jgi:hypothetical protein